MEKFTIRHFNNKITKLFYENMHIYTFNGIFSFENANVKEVMGIGGKIIIKLQDKYIFSSLKLIGAKYENNSRNLYGLFEITEPGRQFNSKMELILVYEKYGDVYIYHFDNQYDCFSEVLGIVGIEYEKYGLNKGYDEGYEEGYEEGREFERAEIEKEGKENDK